MIPAEAGDTPARRALHLLGGFLDDDQRAEAEAGGGFTSRIGERLYWIPLEGSPRCAVLDEGRIEHLCIAPKRGEEMPEGDVALTYLLWLKSDPEGFLAATSTPVMFLARSEHKKTAASAQSSAVMGRPSGWIEPADWATASMSRTDA